MDDTEHLRLKIRNISIGKKFQASKLHADYVTYKKYQNRAVAEIRKAKKII